MSRLHNLGEELAMLVPHLSALVLDMDDCALPTEAVALGHGSYELAKDWLRDHKGKNLAEAISREDFVAGYPGRRFRENMPMLAEMVGVTLTARELDYLVKEEVLRVIGAFTRYLEPMDGVLQALQWARSVDLACGIASSSPKARLLVCTLKAGLNEYIPDSLVTSASDEEVMAAKPDPKVYLRAAEKLGALPEECVAFEDSKSGAEAAVAAGITCLGLVQALPDSQRSKRRRVLLDAGCLAVFDSWAEILEVLKVAHAATLNRR